MSAYSPAGLSKHWGCSQGHIYNMIHSGQLRFFRIGNLIRIATSEVERIECGSSSTGESGRSLGAKKAAPNVVRFIPGTEAKPSEGLRTMLERSLEELSRT